MINWLFNFIYIWILEIVFHVGSFGWIPFSPMLTMANACFLAAIEAGLVLVVPKKLKKLFFWIPLVLEFLVFMVQTVYFHIFKQPLQWRAMFVGGGDALTNYYKEAARGWMECIPLMLIMILPLLFYALFLKRRILVLNEFNSISLMRILVMITLGMVIRFDTLSIGRMGEYEFYQDYIEFIDPISVMQNSGVGVMIERDATLEIRSLLGIDSVEDTVGDVQAAEVSEDAFAEFFGEDPALVPESSSVNEIQDSQETEETVETETPEEIIEEMDVSPYVFEIDYDMLTSLSEKSKEKTWLKDYIKNRIPTNRNEYTGMFEGYNLIFITAEGFSTYAIREDLTPTLYKLTHTGFVFDNYYVPLWQTSTSDGEYVNCTGLIPDGQFSMKKSGNNNMPYALPGFFSQEGAKCYAFHDNSLTYYDRHISHPNLGYDFMAAKKGDMSSSQAEGKIFPMEHPNYWPQSDVEMMQGTIPYYQDLDRFLVYYMTVSGHMNYNFAGNRMSTKNKEAVAGIGMSENARAYIACQIELDHALEYLIQDLDEAGVLENTVICLSADHYPYAMTSEQYEELAGKSLSQDMDVYRNSLILWSPAIEEPIEIHKVCSSIDLLPTLLNLFGFDYDSRMYAGKDIFSSQEGMVIFNDKSFVTDTVAYNKKKKTQTWYRELPDEMKSKYFELAQQEVTNRYQFSAYILRNNYYDLIEQCRIKPDTIE